MNKKKIYEILGAKTFQKIVFKAEKIKYKLIDKFFPDVCSFYDKICDRDVKKLCRKTDDENEKKAIRFKYNSKKLALKKEIETKKNRNYHVNYNNPKDFRKFLLSNRKIHIRGIIKNIIFIGSELVLMPITSGVLFGIIIADLIYNIIGFGVNFQCINLQNYNLCRFDEKKEKIEKIDSRQKERLVQNYSEIGKVICEKMQDEVKIPTIDEIVNSSNKEQLQQLRKLALEIKRKRNSDVNNKNNDENPKQKVLGRKEEIL